MCVTQWVTTKIRQFPTSVTCDKQLTKSGHFTDLLLFEKLRNDNVVKNGVLHKAKPKYGLIYDIKFDTATFDT